VAPSWLQAMHEPRPGGDAYARKIALQKAFKPTTSRPQATSNPKTGFKPA